MASPINDTMLNPPYDLTLSDGTTTLGFILVDRNGNHDPRAIQRINMGSRTALKISQGINKYEDLELPYMSIAQDNWSGGSGRRTFDEDTSRYLEACGINTMLGSGLIRGASPYFAETSNRIHAQLSDRDGGSGGVIWQYYTSNSINKYLGARIYVRRNFTASRIEFMLKKIGNPSSLYVELRADSSGNPGAVLASNTLSTIDPSLEAIGFRTSVSISGSALSAGNYYWVVLRIGSGTYDEQNHWKIGVNYDYDGKESANGTTWGVSNYAPYCRVTNANAYSDEGKFFDYKGAKYYIRWENGYSRIYVNGDRGSADSNSGQLTKLIDATKSWSTDQWKNDIVVITAGKGANDPKNWHKIVSNTTTELTVDGEWETTHDNSTEYVIISSKFWTLLYSLPVHYVDLVVAGEYVLISDTNGSVHYYYEYNDGGVWIVDSDMNILTNTYKMLVLPDDNGGYSLYRHCNDNYNKTYVINRSWIEACKLPRVFTNKPYRDIGLLAKTNIPWDALVIPYVSHLSSDGNTKFVINSAASTGVIAAINLDEPIDVREAEGLRMYIKPTYYIPAGQFSLLLSDEPDLGYKEKAAGKVLTTRPRNPLAVYKLSGTTYTSLSKLVDGIADTTENLNNFPTGDYLFIGGNKPFSSIYFKVVNNNSNTAAMSVYYYNGSGWNSLSITDNTSSGGVTLLMSGAVDFIPMDDWVKSVVNNVEAYWVYIKFSAALDADVVLSDLILAEYETDLPNLYDGNQDTFDRFVLGANDFMYIGGDTKFNEILFTISSTENNGNISTLTVEYFDGSAWKSVGTITDGTVIGGATLAKSGSIIFTAPADWKQCSIDNYEGYFVRITTSARIQYTYPYLGITVYSINLRSYKVFAINISALDSNVWNEIFIAPSTPFKMQPLPDMSSVKSVGLRLNNALTSTIDWYFKGSEGVTLYNQNYIRRDIDAKRINNWIGYASSSNLQVTNPYFITNDGIYEWQVNNDYVIARLPIDEISAIASYDMGKSICKNDVYLWFNIGRKIERYYNGTLEDVGYDKDDGVPEKLYGDITNLTSYPGMVLVSTAEPDYANNDYYSTIMANNGGGWHELLRFHNPEWRINSMSVQSIPGSEVDRLWFDAGIDLGYIDIGLHPDKSEDYYHIGEGYLTTGWIYGGMNTIRKSFASLKIILDDIEDMGVHYGKHTPIFDYMKATAYYQTDEDIDEWKPALGVYSDFIEEYPIDNPNPNGYRIRFRIHITGSTYRAGLIFKAWIMDVFGVTPIKYQYIFNALLSERYNDVNLETEPDMALGVREKAEDALLQLDEWANSATVLTMNSRYSTLNGKKVVVGAPNLVPIEIDSNTQIERHILNIVCQDV